MAKEKETGKEHGLAWRDKECGASRTCASRQQILKNKKNTKREGERERVVHCPVSVSLSLPLSPSLSLIMFHSVPFLSPLSPPPPSLSLSLPFCYFSFFLPPHLR